MMLFHPFISSLDTVVLTSATLLMSSFLFPAPAISWLPGGTRSTTSLWVFGGGGIDLGDFWEEWKSCPCYGEKDINDHYRSIESY